MNQDYSKYTDRNSMSEGCVVFLIIVTMFFGYISSDILSLVMAIGLSAVAASIVHLARVMRSQER